MMQPLNQTLDWAAAAPWLHSSRMRAIISSLSPDFRSPSIHSRASPGGLFARDTKSEAEAIHDDLKHDAA